MIALTAIGMALVVAVMCAVFVARIAAGVRLEAGRRGVIGRNRENGGRAHMWQTIMRMLGEGDADPQTPPAAQAAPTPALAQPVPTHGGARTPIDPDMPGIPGSVRPVLVAMRDRLASIDARLKDADALSQPAILELDQLRDAHLPKLLRSYVEVPDERRREIYARTQKSASVHLLEALTAMHDRLIDIDHGLSQVNLDTFEDNMTFIARQYRGAKDPLA